MFREMCIDSHVFMRLHEDINSRFKKDRHLEFMWQGSATHFQHQQESLSLNNYFEGITPSQRKTVAGMMTHILESHYCSPKYFDFEGGNPAPNQATTDEKRKKLIDSLATTLINEAKKRIKMFQTNQLLIPFGCDFKFLNASLMYESMDTILGAIKSKYEEHKIEFRYSTLSKYFEALRQEQLQSERSALVFPQWSGDFLPYGDEQIWTGFYTSRPQLKAAIRIAESYASVAEKLTSLCIGKYRGYVSDISKENHLFIPWIEDGLGIVRDALSITQVNLDLLLFIF